MLKKSIKFNFKSLTIIAAVLIAVVCAFSACSKPKEMVSEFSLGEGLATVTLNGDYYVADLTDDLKNDDAVAKYQTDGDEPIVIMYRFNWKEQGEYNSMLEYFNHEAETFNSTVHTAWLEEAGKLPCKSYVFENDVKGTKYFCACYAIENGDECIEVLYQDKLDEVKLPGSNAKMYVPKKINHIDVSTEENQKYMIDKRISDTTFFPTFYTYSWQNVNDQDIYSDEIMGYYEGQMVKGSLEKFEVNDYKAFKGIYSDGTQNSYTLYIYECNGYFVELMFSSITDDARAYENLIANSLH